MTSGLAGTVPVPPGGDVPSTSSTWAAGWVFWNVMRVYPGASLGVVMMGNTTSYDHESILDAVAGTSWV